MLGLKILLGIRQLKRKMITSVFVVFCWKHQTVSTDPTKQPPRSAAAAVLRQVEPGAGECAFQEP